MPQTRTNRHERSDAEHERADAPLRDRALGAALVGGRHRLAGQSGRVVRRGPDARHLRFQRAGLCRYPEPAEPADEGHDRPPRHRAADRDHAAHADFPPQYGAADPADRPGPDGQQRGCARSRCCPGWNSASGSPARAARSSISSSRIPIRNWPIPSSSRCSRSSSSRMSATAGAISSGRGGSSIPRSPTMRSGCATRRPRWRSSAGSMPRNCATRTSSTAGSRRRNSTSASLRTSFRRALGSATSSRPSLPARPRPWRGRTRRRPRQPRRQARPASGSSSCASS